jgi:hypothetical protein
MKINKCECGCGGSTCGSISGEEPQNYMFFDNLQTIKKAIDTMLQMDPAQVDQILADGHNWAADHIATSKDDIEEVAGFFMNKMGEMTHNPLAEPNMEMPFVHTFESFNETHSYGHLLNQFYDNEKEFAVSVLTLLRDRSDIKDLIPGGFSLSALDQEFRDITNGRYGIADIIRQHLTWNPVKLSNSIFSLIKKHNNL